MADSYYSTTASTQLLTKKAIFPKRDAWDLELPTDCNLPLFEYGSMHTMRHLAPCS